MVQLRIGLSSLGEAPLKGSRPDRAQILPKMGKIHWFSRIFLVVGNPEISVFLEIRVGRVPIGLKSIEKVETEVLNL